MTKKQEIQVVKELGEKIGYGHLMSLASALWRKSLHEKGYSRIGAFIPTTITSVRKEYQLEEQKNCFHYDKIIEND